ncbi:hypothetical protein [Synechococcus sp. MIT S9508]|uniref:hypothetical protein n=1 Tax=Synechococcus sp. MIT S9508 TaxID=1801629 RepID=UPI001E340BDE|nr:hypothetical protein [Synechococcus sp. MIT S9508]
MTHWPCGVGESFVKLQTFPCWSFSNQPTRSSVRAYRRVGFPYWALVKSGETVCPPSERPTAQQEVGRS